MWWVGKKGFQNRFTLSINYRVNDNLIPWPTGVTLTNKEQVSSEATCRGYYLCRSYGLTVISLTSLRHTQSESVKRVLQFLGWKPQRASALEPRLVKKFADSSSWTEVRYSLQNLLWSRNLQFFNSLRKSLDF